jgi:hypothetical protein
MADTATVAGGAASGAAAGSAFGPWGALAGGVIGGGLGYLQSQESDKVNKALKDQAKKQEQLLAQLMAIGIPSEEALKVVFQKYPMPEEFTPAELNLPTVSGTEMANVKYPEEMKQIEMESLRQLQDISASKGMDAQAKYAYEQAQQEAAQQEQAQRGAIENQMARRGMADSGMAAVSQQMAMQNAQNQAGRVASQQAAEAQRRALEALTQGTALAGKMGSREMEQANLAAQAQDRINQFNTGQMTSQQMQNWQAQNNAALQNLQGRNQTNQANVGIANQQMQANAGIPEKIRNMQISQITGQQTGQQAIGNANIDIAKNNAATTAAGIQAGVGGMTALGNNYTATKKNDADAEAAKQRDLWEREYLMNEQRLKYKQGNVEK